MGYKFTVAGVKNKRVCIHFTCGDGSIMSWDSTVKSTDIKYIHEDIFTNKTRTRSIESRTPSVQMAQAERQNTNIS